MPSEKLLTAMGKYNEGLAKAGVLHEENEIEIRQIFEAEDVGAEFTPELRRQEAVVRAPALGLGAPRFEPGKTMVIAGVNESYTFENRVKIPSQWDRLVPHIGKVPGQIGQISYGVCWNFSPGKGFDYLSGVEVKEGSKLPADIKTVQLGARAYVVFTHPHHVSTIGNTIDKIWNTWVPQAGLKVANAPWFERYSEAFNPQTGTGGMEIWIPLAGSTEQNRTANSDWMLASFPQSVQLTPGETVVFSWSVYQSRTHRDRVNAG